MEFGGLLKKFGLGHDKEKIMSATCVFNIPEKLTEEQIAHLKKRVDSIIDRHQLAIGWMDYPYLNQPLIQSGNMEIFFFVFASKDEPNCSLNTSFMEDYETENACELFSEHFKYYRELSEAVLDSECHSVDIYLDDDSSITSVEDFDDPIITTPDQMLEIMFKEQKEDFLYYLQKYRVWSTGFPTLKITVVKEIDGNS